MSHTLEYRRNTCFHTWKRYINDNHGTTHTSPQTITASTEFRHEPVRSQAHYVRVRLFAFYRWSFTFYKRHTDAHTHTSSRIFAEVCVVDICQYPRCAHLTVSRHIRRLVYPCILLQYLNIIALCILNYTAIVLCSYL